MALSILLPCRSAVNNAPLPDQVVQEQQAVLQLSFGLVRRKPLSCIVLPYATL